MNTVDLQIYTIFCRVLVTPNESLGVTFSKAPTHPSRDGPRPPSRARAPNGQWYLLDRHRPRPSKAPNHLGKQRGKHKKGAENTETLPPQLTVFPKLGCPVIFIHSAVLAHPKVVFFLCCTCCQRSHGVKVPTFRAKSSGNFEPQTASSLEQPRFDFMFTFLNWILVSKDLKWPKKKEGVAQPPSIRRKKHLPKHPKPPLERCTA